MRIQSISQLARNESHGSAGALPRFARAMPTHHRRRQKRVPSVKFDPIVPAVAAGVPQTAWSRAPLARPGGAATTPVSRRGRRHAAGLGPHQLDQRAEGDVGRGRARPRPRADRCRRRVRRPRQPAVRHAQPQPPGADGRGRGRRGLGIQRLRPLSRGALRRGRPVARGPGRARPGRQLDGLAGIDALARHDRGVLGPDPHARGRARPRRDRGRGRAPRRTWRILDGHLAARRFVAGDTLTIGDIPVGASCYRYYGLPIERPQLPNVEAWYGRLKERAPFREHVMVPIT